MCYGNRIPQYFLRAIPAALFRKRNEAVFTSRINLTKLLTPYWIGVALEVNGISDYLC